MTPGANPCLVLKRESHFFEFLPFIGYAKNMLDLDLVSYNILRGEIWYGVRPSFSNAHLHGV